MNLMMLFMNLQIFGAQVIVEGVEKHNPLSEGSILWITESRSPLGLVDEIFGPVKNPYYKVRYNSESEVPSGIHAGSSISFVQEFAHHVLNDKDLYKRGYDASGANDEEMSDEAEFSDDEKEAEYRRMQKMTKRGLDGQKVRNKKNNEKGVKNRDGPRRNAQPSSQPQQIGAGQPPPTQNQHNFSPAAGFLNQGHCSSSSALGQGFVGGTGVVPPFPSAVQAVGFDACNGVWTNGMPFQPPQNAFFPNGFPTNSMPWLSQNLHMPQMPMPNRMPFQQQFDPSQMPMPNRMPFQQQFDPSQMPLHAALLPTYAPGLVAQNAFNQRTFGMGLQGQFTHPSVNVGEQGVLSSGLQVEQNLNMQQSGFAPGNVEAPHQINRSASYSRGRKPYRRGGGRFAGGRGWQQSK
jgi:H/ACA ribonucleoprotein complex non-core subunit NAF1